MSYPNTQRCVWRVTVSPNTYIHLWFTHFDVFEETSIGECDGDGVEVRDVTLGGVDESFGQYCNTNK